MVWQQEFGFSSIQVLQPSLLNQSALLFRIFSQHHPLKGEKESEK